MILVRRERKDVIGMKKVSVSGWGDNGEMVKLMARGKIFVSIFSLMNKLRPATTLCSCALVYFIPCLPPCTPMTFSCRIAFVSEDLVIPHTHVSLIIYFLS